MNDSFIRHDLKRFLSLDYFICFPLCLVYYWEEEEEKKTIFLRRKKPGDQKTEIPEG